MIKIGEAKHDNDPRRLNHKEDATTGKITRTERTYKEGQMTLVAASMTRDLLINCFGANSSDVYMTREDLKHLKKPSANDKIVKKLGNERRRLDPARIAYINHIAKNYQYNFVAVSFHSKAEKGEEGKVPYVKEAGSSNFPVILIGNSSGNRSIARAQAVMKSLVETYS